MAKTPRARPEFDGVAVPIKREMENAGFKSAFLGKTIWVPDRFGGGRWVSAVPKGILDWLYWHPERKLTVFVETKAPGEQPTPGQAAFLADHAGSETQAVCWDAVEPCKVWLQQEGLRTWSLLDGVRYPFGIHNPVVASGPIDFEDM